MYVVARGVSPRLIGVFVVVVFLVATNSLVVEGSTINVPGNYRSIQEAIDHASPGDVIVVGAGVYEGFTVSKSLTILGESNQSVIIRGSITVLANDVRLSSMKVSVSEVSGSSVAVMITGNNVVLVGVIVESYKNGLQVGDATKKVSGTVIERSKIISEDVGIYGSCSDLSVFYSVVVSKSKQAVSGCGVLDLEYSNISGDTAVTTSFWYDGSVIKGNKISGTSTGLYLDGNYHTVSNNEISGGTGVYLKGSGIVVENNEIINTVTGVNVAGSHDNVVRGNRIASSGHAVDVSGNNNMITNNTLMGGRGVHVSTGNGNTIAFNLVNMTGNVGVYLSKYTGGNLVYGNTFWYCYNYEGVDESGGNQWYLENATHRLGNYWSYNKASDNDGDGITDQPYRITTTTGLEILDKYPLAKPLISPYLQTTTTTPTTTTSTTTPTTPATTLSTTPTTPQTSEIPGYQYTPTIVAVIALILLAIVFILLRKRR